MSMNQDKWQRLTACGLLIGIVFLAPMIWSQERAPEAADQETEPATAAETENADEAGDSLLDMILDSGITGVAFMGILGLFSVVAGTVAVERAVNMRREQLMPTACVEELEKVAHGSAPRYSALADSCDNTPAPLAVIVQSGLARQGQPFAEVEKSMEDAASREMADLRARIRPLNTVGSIAPLVGLLGTVVGMIIAFHTASQSGLGKAELLAKGIYMALLTTAGGLSVAIPSLLLGSFFSGRVERYFRDMDKLLIPLVPHLVKRTQPAQEQPQPPKSTPTSTNPLMSNAIRAS